jgi:hypothetical protein
MAEKRSGEDSPDFRTPLRAYSDADLMGSVRVQAEEPRQEEASGPTNQPNRWATGPGLPTLGSLLSSPVVIFLLLSHLHLLPVSGSLALGCSHMATLFIRIS